MAMSCPRTRFIRESIDAASRLIDLAETGEVGVEDEGCAVLSGVLRDCAFAIKKRAEREREINRSLGTWEYKPGEVRTNETNTQAPDRGRAS